MSRYETPSGVSLDGNPNLKDTLRAAEELGCQVWEKSGQGETCVRHPTWPGMVILNHRRKDTNRALLVRLRRLTQATAA